MTSKKRAIISHIFKYASAQYFSQFLGFFTGILTRRFLGPVYMGVYGIIKIVLEYGSYASVGTDITLCYRLPFLTGSGDREGASRLVKVIFNFVMTVSFIYAVAVLAFALSSKGSYSTEIYVGLIVASILVILQKLMGYYITVLRASKDFSVLSIIIVFEAVTNLLLTLFIVSKFNLYGLYFVLLAMPALIIANIILMTKLRLVYSFDFKGIISCIRYSVPLFIKDVLNVILNSVDRIMIAGMLGLEQLGFYSIALMVKSYGGDIVVNGFANVIQPYFMEAYGHKSDAETARKYIMVSSLATSYLMGFILSCIYIAATPFIHYILPKFVPGLTAMRIFLLATFFMTVYGYYYDYLVAINKQRATIFIAALSIVISIVANYLFIRSGHGISGCALATTIAAFVSFIATSAYALYYLQDGKSLLGPLAMILAPLAYCAAALFVISRFISSPNLIVEAAARLMAFIVLFLPAAYYLNKQTGIARIFMSMVMEKIKGRK